jgi:hypothetical protein
MPTCPQRSVCSSSTKPSTMGKNGESRNNKCGGRASLPRIGSLTGSFVAGIINAVIGAVILSAVSGLIKKAN